MIPWPDPAHRLRLLLLAASGVLAVAIGFVLVSPAAAERLIAAGGYYYILGVFALWVGFGWRVAWARRDVWMGWIRRSGWVGVALAAALAFVLLSDTYQHKVLFDEYVLQATAWHMHATKEIGTVVRAYDLFGTWQPIDTFVDKRPYFFAFLLSLIHDLTGYRIWNVFVLNSALAGAFLGLVYWFARQMTNRVGGLLAVALLATLPLVGQNATGAGMEMHNLAMLLFTMCAALLYLRAPDLDRAALLSLSAVLLAQSRYESVVFVGPVALVLLLGWWRAGRMLLPWSTVAVPLLLVPYAWQSRVVTATPLLWQLREGETARFSITYLGRNLTAAVNFFFNVGPKLANSWYLSVLGFAALGWSFYGAVRWWRAHPRTLPPPGALVTVAFGAGIAGNLALLMFYYWSELDEVIASRFALPMCLLLALLAAVFVVRLAVRWPAAPRLAFGGIVAFLLVSGFHAMAYRLYTSENLVMQEVDWEHDFVASRGDGRDVLFITNMSTIPWILWKTPAILEHAAVGRGPQIAWHLRQGTFREVLVAQALRPTSAQGDFGLDPDDLLPPNFHLETVAEKRFGARLARISRIVSIDPESPPAAPAKSPAAPPKLAAAP